jgi:hypothetical protein
LLRYELGMPELQNEESISNSDGSGKFRWICSHRIRLRFMFTIFFCLFSVCLFI